MDVMQTDSIAAKVITSGKTTITYMTQHGMIQRSNLESSFSQNMQTHVILFFDIFAFAVFKFSQFLIFGVGVDNGN